MFNKIALLPTFISENTINWAILGMGIFSSKYTADFWGLAISISMQASWK